MAAHKIPVYSRHATSREQSQFIRRWVSHARAVREIDSRKLKNVSAAKDVRKGIITHLQEVEPERYSNNSPAAISFAETLAYAGVPMRDHLPSSRINAVREKVHEYGRLNAAFFAEL